MPVFIGGFDASLGGQDGKKQQDEKYIIKVTDFRKA